jgi:hypothetical protein
MHAVDGWVRGIPPGESFAPIWFSSFTLGFMVEDSVQALWRRVSSTSLKPSHVTPLWQKLVGYIWVTTWFTLTFPPYAHTVRDARFSSPDRGWMVPFSVAEKIGIPASGALLVLGGAVLKVAVGVEE